MVDIVPFRGLIYNRDIVDISKTVSPPYDVVDEKKRAELISCSDNNIINLTLPAGSGDIKYTNASLMLDKWIHDRILIHDESECLYGLKISFPSPGGIKELTGFIGLARLEDYDSGKILRHEKTMSGPRKDRYRLLEECRTNLGLIYTIYQDSGEVEKVLDRNMAGKPFTDIRPCYNEDLGFSLWRISDTADIGKIKKAMAPLPVLIADGHHRYETSLMYKKSKKAPGPEDYVLLFFVDSGHEELKIYPTHRYISFRSDMDIDKLLPLLAEDYDIKPVTVNNGPDADQILAEYMKKKQKGFILYSSRGAYSLVLKPGTDSSILNKPEVFILHDDLFRVPGLKGKISRISFEHDIDVIKNDIDSGNHDMGIFLNPPSIKNMEDICYSGGLMPQKSTYFWPKPCTGLVMYKM